MITDLLGRNAKECPRHPFLVTTDGSYTYAEAHVATLRFASRVRSMGVKPGDHVALMASNSAAYFVCRFGINLVGAVAVTLSDGLVGDGLQYSLTQSDSKLLIIDSARAPECPAGALSTLAILNRDTDTRFFTELDGQPQAEAVHVPPSDVATILYRLPRGVLSSYAAYEAAGRQIGATVGTKESDRMMVFLPLCSPRARCRASCCRATWSSWPRSPRPRPRRFSASSCNLNASIVDLKPHI